VVIIEDEKLMEETPAEEPSVTDQECIDNSEMQEQQVDDEKCMLPWQPRRTKIKVRHTHGVPISIYFLKQLRLKLI
jgi:hypothetical protein